MYRFWLLIELFITLICYVFPEKIATMLAMKEAYWEQLFMVKL